MSGSESNPQLPYPPHAPADVIAAREALAADVARVLASAGLPVREPDWETSRGPGFDIEVDKGDDAAGGVFVGWTASAQLGEQTGAALLAHEFTHPAIAFKGAVADAMSAAALRILHAAGFSVVVSEDDLRAFDLEVQSGTVEGLGWTL